jgi:4-amino-4-deoxy-L-arabinose transferase-like glycosyltransferase
MLSLSKHEGSAVYLAAIAGLILLRFVAGAVLPLSADEAYYWLWSKHLAAGYYDHPPMIAFLIRAGTAVFGDTAFGVRVVPLLLSIAASWFVWRTGGERACLLFNLTLMIAVETMAATPDAPLIAASAAFLWAMTKLDEDPRWWLAVGAAGGLALLSKYTGFFLGLGALAWMVFVARRWFLSPWPYLGAALALLIFAPNLWWNQTHHWETFAFQFGRVGAGHFTLRYIFEFLGAQLLLASPFVLVAACFTRNRLVIALSGPAILYFAVHALHGRVQGNWPCFLYPMLAAAAAECRGWLRRPAAPVAAVMLLACYAQAFFGVVPLGRKDPVSRLLAFGIPDVVAQVEAMHPAAVLTTDYETTAWFAFYGSVPVVQVNEPERGLGGALGKGPFVYVAEQARDLHGTFRSAAPLAPILRRRGAAPVAIYDRYLVSP